MRTEKIPLKKISTPLSSRKWLHPHPPKKKIENSDVLPHFGNILKNFDSAAESGGIGRWCLDKCITLQEIFNKMELKGK